MVRRRAICRANGSSGRASRPRQLSHSCLPTASPTHAHKAARVPAARRSSAHVGALTADDDEDDENLKLVGAPDWGAVGAAKEPVVGRLGARQSPAQRAQTFNLLSGAHLAPQARVRVAAAPPTRSLFEYSVPPPGVSELGAHLFAEVSPKKLLPGTRPTLGVAGGRAN